MSLLDDDGKLKDTEELFKSKRPGSTRIIFKPSAKPGVPGVFIADAESMKNFGAAEGEFIKRSSIKSAEREIAPPPPEPDALQTIIDIVIKEYQTAKPSDLPPGILPRNWRFKWYKRGIYKILQALCAENEVDE